MAKWERWENSEVTQLETWEGVNEMAPRERWEGSEQRR